MQIPKSGGNYIYIKEIFGPCLGFVRALVSVQIIEPVINVLISKVAAKYLLEPFYLDCDPPQTAINLIAVAINLAVTAMNCMNIELSNRINSYLSYAKIIAMLLIIAIGLHKFLTTGFEGGALEEPWKVYDDSMEFFTVKAAIFGIYNGVYSYVGWDCLNFMTEEIKSPKKNLPMAIYISMPLITVIYILVNVAYCTVLTAEEMAASNAVAVTFFAKALGPQYTYIISILVFMSNVGTLNAVQNFT